MLDIRVRVVMDKLVVSFWCGSHGGPAHCLWSGSQVMGRGGAEEFSERVTWATREFARRVLELQLEELSDDCLT